MLSTHQVLLGDARRLPVDDDSVHLVVTSPPYPMIEMWDAVFASMDPAIPELGPLEAFEAQHAQLDAVWRELHRVLVPGGICCINIGDATRSVDGHFRLFHNHARIVTKAVELGFTVLPDILWRKPTNAPNKFMGSGMLPGGAYVTYEHEYVLVLRKGNKRGFKDAPNRRRSAYFWEERNVWFSDLWELKGTRQSHARGRSAAFPLELPWRLILMYSVYGDCVLDPFGGTGTTSLAAAMAGRRTCRCSWFSSGVLTCWSRGRSLREKRSYRVAAMTASQSPPRAPRYGRRATGGAPQAARHRRRAAAAAKWC